MNIGRRTISSNDKQLSYVEEMKIVIIFLPQVWDCWTKFLSLF